LGLLEFQYWLLGNSVGCGSCVKKLDLSSGIKSTSIKVCAA
jgi:hypothetical protein